MAAENQFAGVQPSIRQQDNFREGAVIFGHKEYRLMARWTMRRALLALALLIALSGCGASDRGNSRPLSASVTATATVTLPAGWYTAPTPGGRIFANNSGFRGLVASPANPSEIAGCGLPLPGGDQTARPSESRERTGLDLNPG